MKKFIYLILIFLFSSNAIAVETHVAWSKGNSDCYEYVILYEESHKLFFTSIEKGKFQATNEEFIQYQNFKEWITYYYGFVSSSNYLDQEHGGDAFKEMKPIPIAIELNNYCKNNPSKAFIKAVINISHKYKKNK